MSSKSSEGRTVDLKCGNELQFHHVHLYVDKLDTLANYKILEDRLNRFGITSSDLLVGDRNTPENIEKAKGIWKDLGGNPPTSSRGASGRDVVRQLLVGPGFRVTGSADSDTTRSVRLTSRDCTGTKIIVTAPISGGLQGLPSNSSSKAVYPHLSLSPMYRAVNAQKTRTRRPSIAVLVCLLNMECKNVVLSLFLSLSPTSFLTNSLTHTHTGIPSQIPCIPSTYSRQLCQTSSETAYYERCNTL